MASQLDSGNTPDDDEKSPFKAYVGIDFGTDGSGLAYGLPDGSAYIHNMWDDTAATKKPKTSVLFDSGGTMLRVGSEAQDLYLKTANVGWKLFERFKMNLYEEPSTKSHLRNAQSKMEFVELKEKIITTNDRNVTEDASKVFIEELIYLKKQAFKFIETHLRKKLNLSGDQQNGWPEIQYFLTVPAIWGDKAKDQMVKWAQKAGLISGTIENQLKIVYEPDCASLSIQHAILRNMKNNNKQDHNKQDHNKQNDNDTQNKFVLPDINEWLKINNLQKYTTHFNEENLTMDELLDLGEDPADLKEYLGSLQIPQSSIIRICLKVKKMIQQRKTNNDNNSNNKNNNNNDSMKLHPLQPQINIYVPLKKGDQYILLDVGGGTCDVACHEVMGDFEIAEVLHPSGGKWGATYIDERFIKLLGELFTADLLDVFQMAEDDGRSSYLTFRAHFLNEAKLSFYDKQNMYHDIAMSSAFVTFICNQYNQKYNEGEDSLNVDKILNNLNEALASLSLMEIINGNFQEKFNCKTDKNDKKKTWIFKIKRANKYEVGEDYVLSMHVSVWKMLFDTIIDPIIDHCKAILLRQEMKGTKYIFLVGGFADCKYFQLRMEKEFYNLDVVMPGLPGLCVVDGAARYAMDKKFVKIRRLARSYGTKNSLVAANLELEKFPKGYVKFYDNQRKAEYVQDCFNVFVKKNQAIRVGGKAITQTTYKRYKSQTSVAISIIATEKDNVYLAKDCGKALGQVVVPLPKDTDNGTVVEFQFDTKLTVFAYPKGKPSEIQKCEVDYY